MSDHFKNKDSLWMDAAFYFLSALFLVLLFSYFVFDFRVWLDTQKVNESDNLLSAVGSPENRAQEGVVLDYKKKIDDYGLLIKNHRISSNIFSFIEEKTLPNVWFFDFDMSGQDNKIKLSGESENMEILGLQISAFEKNKDYIARVNVLGTEFQDSGRVKFALELHFTPQIFVYTGI